jgi:hypothetical protein
MLNNRLLRPIWFHQNCQKNQENKEKIVKVFARILENVLYFYRPHPTSVVGANFYGCIFFYACSEKIIKNSEKVKKFDSY